MSTGTRCSYVLPVPRLVLPRLAYHVEHQDKRIRRGVGVRAGGSQGRRELQAAADNELVTEKHVHTVYSSVFIWLDSFPLRHSFPGHDSAPAGNAASLPSPQRQRKRSQGRTGAPCRALPAHTLSLQLLLASQLQRHPARVLVRGCYDSLKSVLDLRARTVLPAPQRAAPRPARGAPCCSRVAL